MSTEKSVTILRKHKKLFILLGVFVVVSILVFVIWTKISSAKDTSPKMNLQTTRLTKMDLSTSVSVTGTIASKDARSVSTSVKDVKVEDVKVSVGDYVNQGDVIVTLDSSDLKEELDNMNDNLELDTEKTNKTVSDAANSITQAQDTYQQGVDDQNAMVADAKSQYNVAVAGEEEKKAAFEKAQAQTEKAKKAYDTLKDKQSDLKKSLDKAEKANKKAQETLSKAQEEYETAQATAKDENGNIDQTLYQTYLDAQAGAQQAQNDYDKAQSDYNKIAEAKSAYAEAQKSEEEAKKVYEEASGHTSGKYAEYEKSLQTQDNTNKKNAEAIEDNKSNYSITVKEASNNLKSQKTQVQDTEEKLGECVVTSPISGVITALNVSAGDTYDGSELFVVQDMSGFVVDASVDEYDISKISKDMKAVIKTDATEEDEISGVITYVAPTPESTTSSGTGSGSSGSQSSGSGSSGSTSSSSSSVYKIQIALEKTDERLRIGMTAKTSIVLESKENVFAVPYDCIQEDHDGTSYIMVIKNDSRQENRQDINSQNNKNQENNQQENSKQEINKGDQITNKTSSMETEKIVVEKGLESDYYVEITSDQLTEGLQVVIPTEDSTNKNDKSATAQFNFGGMPGQGSNMGTGKNGGGAPGNAPRGF